MKRLLTIIAIILAYNMLFAQEFYNAKYDYVWLFGDQSFPSTESFGGSFMNFNYDPPLIEEVYRIMDFDFTNASICDNEGYLQFYSNGFHVGNPLDEIMDNGDTILLDTFNFGFSSFGTALRIRQGALILPRPGSAHVYDLFHEEFGLDSAIGLWVPHCLHSVIDMQENNGLGKVIEKSTILLQDTLDFGQLTATRHANGRDWWMLIPEYGTNVFYRFLITPEGVISKPPQAFGTAIPYAGTGQNVFSPDGSKYIRVKYGYAPHAWGVSIYDFDRCSGLLTAEYPFDQSVSGLQYPVGASVSPNSRFFYLLEDRHLWQYDLYDQNIQNSKIKVAEWDGSTTPFSTGFGKAQSGPDGKIYLSSGNGNNTLNIISNPNEEGIACDVIMNGVQLPTWNNSLPNLPNYRLGPIDGSSCDTLGIDNPLISVIQNNVTQDEISFRIYPNPAHDYLIFQFKTQIPKEANIQIYDNHGEMVLQRKLNPVTSTIDIENIVPGIYFYKVNDLLENAILYTGKFIKI